MKKSKLPTPILSQQWIIHAREFLNAVHKLEITELDDLQNVFGSAPTHVLMAYAFELLFKAESNITHGTYDISHDLTALWEKSKPRFKMQKDSWQKLYVAQRRKAFTGEYAAAALQLDPQIGLPIGDFESNLTQLNLLTKKPYQSRYPVVAISGVVDIRYLHFVGMQIFFQLQKEMNVGLNGAAN